MVRLKKLLSMLLALVMCVCLLPFPSLAEDTGSLDNFTKKNTFDANPFTDCKESDWFYNNVKSVYEYGLMNGRSADTFAPSDGVTLAETIVIASRLHAIYYNESTDFPQTTPWYQAYVDYGHENGFVYKYQYEQWTDADYTAPATRAQFAMIIVHALPSNALERINEVEENGIPDVQRPSPNIPDITSYFNEVYTMYGSGVMTGSDDQGTFHPEANIVRSEVAAVISRVVDTSLRKTITLNAPRSGKCGDNLTWSIHDDILEISGTGAMWDYSLSYSWGGAPWLQFSTVEYHSLKINEGITRIGACAFHMFPLTGGITLPDGLLEIGYAAFSPSGDPGYVDNGNYSDKNSPSGTLVIPDSVTTIEACAFWGCSKLTGNLVLPASLTTLGGGAFGGCSGFTGSLVIPEGVTTIGDVAFQGCSGLNGTLTLPSTLTTIEQYAFNGCENLTGELKLPSGLTTIGKHVFYGCKGLTGNLVIPTGITTIGEGTFAQCSGLTGDLIIPNGVTTIGVAAFYQCTGFNGKLAIPDSVSTIEDWAFSFCSNLTGSLNIPAGVTTIGNAAFQRCENLTEELKLPSGITSIEPYTFNGCKGLSGTLVIPDGVTSIGRGAFAECSGLTSPVNIPATVTSINGSAFYGLPDLTVILPAGLTYSGEKLENGVPFGTGSYYNGGDTYDKAWDGDPNTHFDPAESATTNAYTGINFEEDLDEGDDYRDAYVLTEIKITPRKEWLDRFDGAEIQGSNDGKTWTTLWVSSAAAKAFKAKTISAEELSNNTGYRMFRYVNQKNHGDVAEIELYGYVVQLP